MHEFNDEVVATAADRKACIGKHAAQSALVNESLFILPLDFCHELITGVEQSLVVALGIEVEVEVAAVDSSSRLIVRRQGINPHVAGTESLSARSHGKVAHVSLHLMVHFQIAVNVEMCATADGQQAIGDAQPVQVGTVEVHHHRATQALLTHQHIHRGDALHEVVLAVHGGIGTPVPDFCIGLHATEVVATILELLNVGLRRKRRARRHQVGALSFQVDGAGEWAQPVVRQEVLQRQAVGFQLCLVGFTTGIVAHRSTKGTSRLAGGEAGTVFLSVGSHSAFQGEVARNVHILAQVLRHEFL